jgi:hypothetical protein
MDVQSSCRHPDRLGKRPVEKYFLWQPMLRDAGDEMGMTKTLTYPLRLLLSDPLNEQTWTPVLRTTVAGADEGAMSALEKATSGSLR